MSDTAELPPTDIAVDIRPQPDAASRPDPPDAPQHFGCYGNRAGWIVVTTHPQAEFWANTNLTRRGYQTYLPLYAVRVRDRVTRSLNRIVERPLFAGYLFCHYDSRDPRRPIRETPGVRDVIRCGSVVQYASAGAVEALQATEATRRRLTPAGASWAPGTAAAVANGTLAGHRAVVLAVQRETATIAIMMFGHLREVSLHVDCLRLCDSD